MHSICSIIIKKQAERVPSLFFYLFSMFAQLSLQALPAVYPGAG